MTDKAETRAERWRDADTRGEDGGESGGNIASFLLTLSHQDVL